MPKQKTPAPEPQEVKKEEKTQQPTPAQAQALNEIVDKQPEKETVTIRKEDFDQLMSLQDQVAKLQEQFQSSSLQPEEAAKTDADQRPRVKVRYFTTEEGERQMVVRVGRGVSKKIRHEDGSVEEKIMLTIWTKPQTGASIKREVDAVDYLSWDNYEYARLVKRQQDPQKSPEHVRGEVEVVEVDYNAYSSHGTGEFVPNKVVIPTFICELEMESTKETVHLPETALN